jgi:hypothetical protein
MVSRTPYYNVNGTYNASPSRGSKTKTDRLRRHVSKLKREANRRNGDRTNNRYTFDRADKRAIAKELDVVLRDLKEHVHAIKEARKPTSKRRKLAYAVGAVAVAGGLYSQSNLILSALPKIVAVAKGVYPAASAKLAYLKGLPKAIASSSQSVAIKNKAKVAYNAIRAVAGSGKTRAMLTAKAAYNYVAPYLARRPKMALKYANTGSRTIPYLNTGSKSMPLTF